MASRTGTLAMAVVHRHQSPIADRRSARGTPSGAFLEARVPLAARTGGWLGA